MRTQWSRQDTSTDDTATLKRRRQDNGHSYNKTSGSTFKATPPVRRWKCVTSRLSTLKPMQRIALDTIVLMDISKDFRYIIVEIVTITRYFPAHDVTAAAATDVLWRHFYRFGTPLEIVTDQGSQFMNQTYPSG